MIVQCPGCQKEYSLDESKIKENGIKVRCRKCRYIWVLTKDLPTLPKKDKFSMEIVKIIQKNKFKGDFEARVHQLRTKIKDDQKPLNSTLRIIMALEKDPASINFELLKEYMRKRSVAASNRTSLFILPKEDYLKQFPEVRNDELDSAIKRIIDKPENQFISIGVNKYRYIG